MTLKLLSYKTALNTHEHSLFKYTIAFNYL